MELSSLLVEAIGSAAEKVPGLIAAYVFGSTVRCAERPRDLDIALLWDASVPVEARWRDSERFALSVERRMPEPRNVDVVDLREAPPTLQYRILTEGRRVFDREPVQRTRFEALTLSMATDFVEWQAPYLEQWRKAVASGR